METSNLFLIFRPNGITLNVILFSHKKIERNKSHRTHRIFVIENMPKLLSINRKWDCRNEIIEISGKKSKQMELVGQLKTGVWLNHVLIQIDPGSTKIIFKTSTDLLLRSIWEFINPSPSNKLLGKGLIGLRSKQLWFGYLLYVRKFEARNKTFVS